MNNTTLKDYKAVEIDPNKLQNYYSIIGKNVQRERQKRGITQIELATMMGFKSTSLIAGAESGYNGIKFSLEHLCKIAIILQVDINLFFENLDFLENVSIINLEEKDKHFS